MCLEVPLTFSKVPHGIKRDGLGQNASQVISTITKLNRNKFRENGVLAEPRVVRFPVAPGESCPPGPLHKRLHDVCWKHFESNLERVNKGSF